MIEQYKGSIIVDTKLELKTKEKGATCISTPSEHYINATNLIWILKDIEEISTFKTKVIDFFTGINFTTEITNISGGENLKLELKTAGDKKLNSCQIHVKIYHKNRKIMIQGNTMALNKWISAHNDVSNIQIEDVELIQALNSINTFELNVDSGTVNSLDQQLPAQDQSKNDTYIVDNDANPPISPKKFGILTTIKETVGSLESNFTVFKSEVETDFKTIVENIKSLITLEMFNDKTKQIENSFKLQVNNLSSRISELEVNKYNLEERIKQLEGKDKANNKRISKLENLVRNLSSQTNHDEVVSSSIETSNTEYQLDENIAINIPTSNKFSPFQTMQDYSSTNTA